MCYSIAIVLRAEYGPLPDGLHFVDCDFVSRRGPGVRVVCVTDGHCSCALVDVPEKRDAQLLVKVDKYEKLGWSPQKIQRALHDSKAAGTKSSKPSPAHVDFTNWLAETALCCGPIQVLVHWAGATISAGSELVPFLTSDLSRRSLPKEAWIRVG